MLPLMGRYCKVHPLQLSLVLNSLDDQNLIFAGDTEALCLLQAADWTLKTVLTTVPNKYFFYFHALLFYFFTLLFPQRVLFTYDIILSDEYSTSRNFMEMEMQKMRAIRISEMELSNNNSTLVQKSPCDLNHIWKPKSRSCKKVQFLNVTEVLHVLHAESEGSGTAELVQEASLSFILSSPRSDSSAALSCKRLRSSGAHVWYADECPSNPIVLDIGLRWSQRCRTASHSLEIMIM